MKNERINAENINIIPENVPECAPDVPGAYAMPAVMPGAGKKTGAWSLFDPARRRCGYDNGKVGASVATVSVMPGTAASLDYNAAAAVLDEYKNMIDVYGVRACVSCPHDCPGCYAMSEKRYPAVMETWLLNTIELHCNPEKFYSLVENELFAGPHAGTFAAVRIHEGGEFINEKDFSCALAMMKRHPDMVFYGYSKMDFVGRAYESGTIPENVRFSCSPWITRDGVVLCAPVSDMHQFIFDDGTDPARDSIVHCYASNPDGTVNHGNTCDRCRRCINARKGTQTAVYPHGNGIGRSWLAGRMQFYIETVGMDMQTAAESAYNDAMRNARVWARNIAPESVPALAKKLVAGVKRARKKDAESACTCNAGKEKVVA